MIALLYIPILLILAWYNCRLIAEGRRIYHALNGLLHISVAAGVWYLAGWQAGIAVLFIARVVFDSALNLMRDLPIDYVSPNPKSKVDQFEKWLFRGNGLIPKIVYLIAIILLLSL